MRLRHLGPGVSITQPLPWLAASPGWTHPRVGAGDGPTTAPGRRGGDTRPMERRTGPSLLPAAELDTWSQQRRSSYPDQHQHSDTCAAGHVPTTLDTRAQCRAEIRVAAVLCRHARSIYHGARAVRGKEKYSFECKQ